MHINNSTDIQTRRRNYYRHDIEANGRPVGSLISTPAGYQLHTRDTRFRWYRRRFWRTPGHLADAVRLQRIRGMR
jgi:hypothetical protein